MEAWPDPACAVQSLRLGRAGASGRRSQRALGGSSRWLRTPSALSWVSTWEVLLRLRMAKSMSSRTGAPYTSGLCGKPRFDDFLAWTCEVNDPIHPLLTSFPEAVSSFSQTSCGCPNSESVMLGGGRAEGQGRETRWRGWVKGSNLPVSISTPHWFS